MSLALDKRQRAMLREMGVPVWQPPPRADAPPPEVEAFHTEGSDATYSIAAGAMDTGATGTNALKIPAEPVAIPAAARPVLAPVTAATAAPGWQLGGAQPLYAIPAPADGARWLVLAETPTANVRAQPFNPFDGDAGKLLGNMLRALRLDKTGGVWLAPLARLAAGNAAGSALPDALVALIAQAQPDVVLVMGRLAGQAVLQRNEPLGKLRGQVHGLHGVPAVMTYDAAYLLRNPLEKAKAWEDLCLALEVSRRAA